MALPYTGMESWQQLQFYQGYSKLGGNFKQCHALLMSSKHVLSSTEKYVVSKLPTEWNQSVTIVFMSHVTATCHCHLIYDLPCWYMEINNAMKKAIRY